MLIFIVFFSGAFYIQCFPGEKYLQVTKDKKIVAVDKESATGFDITITLNKPQKNRWYCEIAQHDKIKYNLLQPPIGSEPPYLTMGVAQDKDIVPATLSLKFPKPQDPPQDILKYWKNKAVGCRIKLSKLKGRHYLCLDKIDNEETLIFLEDPPDTTTTYFRIIQCIEDKGEWNN